jgi:hypothetical protein
MIAECVYPIEGVTADSEITLRMQEWWKLDDFGILWVQTAPQDDFVHNSLASDMVALSREADIPVLAYFCRRLDPDGQAPNQVEILANMMYSLVYQMSMHLASVGELSATSDMMETASKLDGSARSLSHALEFIRKFLAMTPGRLLLVLDGLEILEYSNDTFLEQHLRGLYRLLRECEPSIKTLMLTEGHSGMISDGVGWENTVDASMGNGSDGFFSIDEFREGCVLEGC